MKITPHKIEMHNYALTIFNSIKTFHALPKIEGLTKGKLDYLLKILKELSFIEKVGLGTWEIKVKEFPNAEEFFRQKKTHHVERLHTLFDYVKPDSVRGHGIVATVKIPKLDGWGNRAEILEKNGTPFRNIPQGIAVSVGNVEKVWLCNDSLVFYLPYSWYGKDAETVAFRIVQDVIKLVEKTETLLKVEKGGFKLPDGSKKVYFVKFSRQHYALIKNSLAKQYGLEKKKLFVYDEKGLWLLIDNSFNLHELENIRAETAVNENMIIQNFFNSLKECPVTPQFLVENINRVTANQELYSKNIETHIQAIKDLAIYTKQIGEAVQDLKKTLKGNKDVNR